MTLVIALMLYEITVKLSSEQLEVDASSLNKPPTPVITITAPFEEDKPIKFSASSSYDSDGKIVTFWWDFGDGTNYTGISTNHAYKDEAPYSITLMVIDNDLERSIQTRDIVVDSKWKFFEKPPVSTMITVATFVFPSGVGGTAVGMIVRRNRKRDR